MKERGHWPQMLARPVPVVAGEEMRVILCSHCSAYVVFKKEGVMIETGLTRPCKIGNARARMVGRGE